MKKGFLSILILLAGSTAFGQTETQTQKTEMKTLFGNSKHKINYLGVYVSPEIQYGQLDGTFQPFVGNSVMLQFNKKFAIGLSGSASVKNATTTMRGAFGGLKLEYTPKPDALLHVSFPVLIGGGTTGSTLFDNAGGMRGMGHHGKGRGFGGGWVSDSLRTEGFVVQPGMVLEANLFRYVKAYAGVNYRVGFASGYSAALSGFSANAGIKLGVFDYAVGKREGTRRKMFRKRTEK